jgi:hypothetical protein
LNAKSECSDQSSELAVKEIFVNPCSVCATSIVSNVQSLFGAPFTIPRFQNIKRSRHSGIEAGFSLLLFKGLAQIEDALRLHGAYPFSCFVVVTSLPVAA